MLLKYRLIPPIILLISLLIGCVDDSVNQTGNTIRVHLTDINGFDFPTRYAVPNISIGDYPISLTDQMGRCNFSNKPVPYNITIWGGPGFLTFKKVSTKDPEIVLTDEEFIYQTQPSNYCYFRVSMTKPQASQIAILRFISKDVFFEDPYDFVPPNDFYPPVYRHILIPSNKKEINGKLVLIYCNGYFDSSFVGRQIIVMTSFDSIAVKDINISTENHPIVTFSHEDMIINSQSSHISYSTGWYHYPFNEAYFTFPGYSQNSDILFYRWDNPVNTIPVPTDLTIPFEIKMRSIMEDYPSRIKQQVIERGNVGSEFYLEHKFIQVQEPPEIESGLNDSSVFKFKDYTGNRIYVFTIDDYYYTFTDKNEITFGELKNRGFSPERGTQHFYKIYEFYSFSGIDDFLSSPYMLRDQFTRISGSGSSHFYIAK